MKDLKDLFPFEYVGTGYFRLKGVPKGTNASEYAADGIGIIHGMQAIEYFYNRIHAYATLSAKEETGSDPGQTEVS